MLNAEPVSTVNDTGVIPGTDNVTRCEPLLGPSVHVPVVANPFELVTGFGNCTEPPPMISTATAAPTIGFPKLSVIRICGMIGDTAFGDDCAVVGWPSVLVTAAAPATAVAVRTSGGTPDD